MRLTCPNCGAQYEVPDDVIPTQGRDVQCSACGTTWFFAHPDHPGDDAEGPAAAPDTPQAEAPDDDQPDLDEATAGGIDADAPLLETPPRRELDPEVAEILRAEAERETKLRASDRAPQPDHGAEPANAPEPTESTAPPETASGTATSVTDPPSSPKPDLPDQKEIAATLQNPRDPQDDTALPRAEPPRKGGFMRGFSLVILLVVALLLIYSNAEGIAQAVPSAAPLLDNYVDLVNQGRVWLEATINPPAPEAPAAD